MKHADENGSLIRRAAGARKFIGFFACRNYRRLSFRKLKARLKAVGPAVMNGLIVLKPADDYASGNDLRVQASSAK